MTGTPRPWRRGRVALPALGAGILVALSLPPFGWWPLAFAGSGILFWRLAGLGGPARLWAGWLTGVGCFGIGLFWARSFTWYGAVVLIAIEALSMGAAAVLTPPGPGPDRNPGHGPEGGTGDGPAVSRPRGRAAAVLSRTGAFVGAFTLLEALRATWPFGGLPIGGVDLGQAQGPLLPLVRLGGPLLLTAAVWAGGAGAATVVVALVRRRRESTGRVTGNPDRPLGPGDTGGDPVDRDSRGWRPLAAGSAVLVGLVAVSAVSAVLPDGGPGLRGVTVAAVQGGGRRGFDKEQVNPTTVFDAQLAATYPLESTGHHGDDRLVLWPEDVISIDGPLARSAVSATMSSLARHLDATVVAGVTSTVSDHAFLNQAVAWSPDGRIVATYEKVHRVPFGEYVPYRGFFSHLANLSEIPLDAVPGHGTGLMRTPAGPLGAMVSYEVFYADRGRPSVRAGAELLIVPTNTSSYATSQVPSQEVAADEIQAVENGRDLVQAAPTGYSTVVTNTGHLSQRSVLGRRQVLTATVALRRGNTLYVDLGDTPVLVLGALAVVGAWLVAYRRRVTATGAGGSDPMDPGS